MRVMMAGATGMVGLAMLNAARRGSGRLVLESGDTCALGAGKVIGLQLEPFCHASKSDNEAHFRVRFVA
jgi:hypothetical protein